MNNQAMTDISAGKEQGVTADVFSFLDLDGKSRISALVTQRTLAQDEYLFVAGDQGDGVFFLVQGRLSVLSNTVFHRKMQVVAILEPGAVVGEAAILPGHVRGVSVRAIEPSLLYCLHRSVSDELALQDIHLFSALLKRLLRISSLRLEKASGRLAHVL